ncbi:MAG: hypothetical protein ACI3W5_13315 [Faecousia sp.]
MLIVSRQPLDKLEFNAAPQKRRRERIHPLRHTATAHSGMHECIPYGSDLGNPVGGDAHIAPQKARRCFYGTVANP